MVQLSVASPSTRTSSGSIPSTVQPDAAGSLGRGIGAHLQHRADRRALEPEREIERDLGHQPAERLVVPAVYLGRRLWLAGGVGHLEIAVGGGGCAGYIHDADLGPFVARSSLYYAQT